MSQTEFAKFIQGRHRGKRRAGEGRENPDPVDRTDSMRRARHGACRRRGGLKETMRVPAHLRHRPHPCIPRTLDGRRAWPRLRASADRDRRCRCGLRQNFATSIRTAGCPSSRTTALCCSSRSRSRSISRRSIRTAGSIPARSKAEAQAWQWSFWAIAEVDRGVNIWSLHAVRLPRERTRCRKARGGAQGDRKAVRGFSMLRSRNEPYLLGDAFTVADLNVAAVISRAIDMDLSAVPNLKTWLTRCLDAACCAEGAHAQDEGRSAKPRPRSRGTSRASIGSERPPRPAADSPWESAAA